MTQWGFIDYENLPQAAQANHDRLYIFVGPEQKNHGLTPSKQVNIIPIKGQGQNNLDFHLAYYLGLAHQVADKQQIEFIIYTKDIGLDNLITFIKQQGRKCQRISHVKDSLPEDVEYLVDILRNTQAQSRPKKQTTLRNSIHSVLQNIETSLTAEKVLNLLHQHKLIEIDSQNRITYHL